MNVHYTVLTITIGLLVFKCIYFLITTVKQASEIYCIRLYILLTLNETICS